MFPERASEWHLSAYINMCCSYPCMPEASACVGHDKQLARRGRGANPIAHVLQAIDEPLDLIEYNRWNVVLPEGQFLTEVGNAQFEEVLQQVSPSGIPQWQVGLPPALVVVLKS